jgi:hypothetical protein
VKITMRLTVSELGAAIESMIGEASLSGLGADSTSEYEIVGVTIDSESLQDFECEVEIEVERIEGKFVGKDEMTDTLTEHIEGSSLDVSVEVA